MKIRSDLLKIQPMVDKQGKSVEPEQQVVQRVIQTDLPTTMQRGGKQVGTIPGEIVYTSTAGEMAQAMRRPCFSCAKFSRRAWKALYARWADPTTPIDERNQLNGIRAALLQTSNAKIQDRHLSQEGDMDVEHALSVLGGCEPLTEVRSTPVIVCPTGSCPGEVCTPTQPNGFYVAKDKAAERMGSATFDNLMKVATGKKL